MKYKYIVLAIFLASPFVTIGQQNEGLPQKAFCHNFFDNIDIDLYKEKIKTHQLKHGHDQFVVRIFVHIMQRDNGTGGISEAEAFDAIQQLNSAYNFHDICFSLLGIDEINDSDLFAFDLDNAQNNPIFFAEWQELVETNAHEEAIDIYVSS